jgi:WD40 repeat protein
LWDVATSELIRLFPGRSRAEFSSNGDTIACISAASPVNKKVGRVDLYNLRDGSLVRSFDSEKGPSASWLLCVIFSPDGHLLAATDWNGIVTLWDVATGQRKLATTDHNAGVVSAAFSPDGEVLATGSEDKTLRLWKLSDALTEQTQQ